MAVDEKSGDCFQFILRGDMNVCIKSFGNPSNTCGKLLLKTKNVNPVMVLEEKSVDHQCYQGSSFENKRLQALMCNVKSELATPYQKILFVMDKKLISLNRNILSYIVISELSMCSSSVWKKTPFKNVILRLVSWCFVLFCKAKHCCNIKTTAEWLL